MTTYLDDEIARVPGESVIPTDLAPVEGANPAWTLTDGVWETVTTEDVTVLEWVGTAALTPRMQYVLTIDVHASADAELRWLIHQTYYDGGTLTLADGAANIDPTTPIAADAWAETARAWNAPEGIVEGHFATEVTAPIGTTIRLRNPFAAPLNGPLVVRQVIAGNPDGARVVLAGDALTAYDSTGTETARITGEGGEFVGGEFRTSDNQAGQVALSDTAYLPSWGASGRPGIRVEPEDDSATDIPPGIGASAEGMVLDGGRNQAGESSFFRAAPAGAMMRTVRGDGTWAAETFTSPDASLMRTYATDGGYSVIQAMPIEAILRSVRANGESGNLGATQDQGAIRVVNANGLNQSRITATRSAVTMFTFAGGVQRYLEIDADGIWVRTARNGTLRSHNLEETATMPAPELLPYAVTTGWDTQHSPLGSVLVTYSTTGRHCQSRVRFNRRGDDFPLTTTNTSIGQVIPAEVRHTISMVDYIPITLPGGVEGELVADYRYGHIYLRTLTGTSTMGDGDYVYATLSWFIPN